MTEIKDPFPPKETIEEELAAIAAKIPAVPSDFSELRQLLALLPNPIPSETLNAGMGDPGLFSVGAARPDQSSSGLIGPPPAGTSPAVVGQAPLTTHGWQPAAYMEGFEPSGAYTTAGSLPANGGCVLLPMVVRTPMSFSGVSIWNTDTTLARTWNWYLWEQVLNTSGSNKLKQLAKGYQPEAFTAGAASKRSIPYVNGVSTPVSSDTSVRTILGSSDGNYVFMRTGTGTASKVSKIRTDNNTIVSSYLLGSSAIDMALTPNGSYLYVTTYNYAHTVVVIATSDMTLVTTIDFGTISPAQVFIAPDGNHVYTVNVITANVTVIQTSDNTIVTSINVFTSPSSILITPDSTKAYVSSYIASPAIAVIRKSDWTNYASISVGYVHMGVAYDNSYLYFNASVANQIVKVRTSDNAIVANPTAATGTNHLSLTPDKAYIWITCQGSNNVQVLRTSDDTMVATKFVFAQPRLSRITADGQLVYVALDNGTVIIYRASDYVELTSASSGTSQSQVMYLTPNSLTAYVGDGSITPFYYVITIHYSTTLEPGIYWLQVQNLHASNTFGVGTLAAGTLATNRAQTKTVQSGLLLASPAAQNATKMACATPNGSYVYVPNQTSYTVSCIRTSDDTNIANIAVGTSPIWCVATPDSAYIYVCHFSSTTVQRITVATNTVTATINTTYINIQMRISADGAYIYCIDSNSSPSHLTVIRTSDNTVVATITLGGNAAANFCITPDDAYIYIPHSATSSPAPMSVVRRSDHTLLTTIANVGNQPKDCVASLDSAYVFVISYQSPYGITVVRVSDNTVVKTILPGGWSMPQNIVISPDGKYLYATTFASPANIIVIRVSDQSFVKLISGVCAAGQQMVVSPTNDLLWVGHNSYVMSLVRLSDWTTVLRAQWPLGYANGFPVIANGKVYFAAFATPGAVFVYPNADPTALDATLATWTKQTGIYAAVMEGRVFGQTAAF